MKKSWIVLLTFFAVAVVAADKTPFSVQKALTTAVIGERTAAARYDAFAAKAQDEGYLGVANLFRAEAKAERIHLQRFTALMIERNLSLPPEETPRISVGSTKENLQSAISAEQAERDSTYLWAINACNDGKDSAAAQVFDVTRDAEVEHANLNAAAARDLNAMKQPRDYYVCEHCGYTTEIKLPLCPSCRDQHPPELVHQH